MATKKEKKPSKAPTIESLQKQIQDLKDDNRLLSRTILRHIDMKFKKHSLDVDTLTNNVVVCVREELRAKERLGLKSEEIAKLQKKSFWDILFAKHPNH